MNTLNPEPERQFQIKDKTGRGAYVTLTQDELLITWDDEPDWDGVQLREFTADADIGDTWDTL